MLVIRESGFALLSTIVMMVLLTIIVVGLLSLSNITLRSSGSLQPHAMARANAKLSLQLAIARLQELAGPDTRITAPASAVNGVNGPQQLNGVWRSWEGDDRNGVGMPIPPNYDSKMQQATTSDGSEGKFLGWLVSGQKGESDVDSPGSLEVSEGSVPLLGQGTLGDDSNEGVHLVPTTVSTEGVVDGAYAWWIQGENTKVRLNPTEEAPDTNEATEQMLVSPGPSGSAFGIEDTAKIERVSSRLSLDFLADQVSSGPGSVSEYFHDITSSSVGLLTNNANGGWKRDLSIFTEEFGRIRDGFSSYTLKPGEEYLAAKFDTSASARQRANLYPWYSDKVPGEVFPDAVSWGALVDFATRYRELRTSGSEVARVLGGTGRTHTQWTDEVRPMPVLARIHWLVSLGAEPDSASRNLIPTVILNPVLTIWNPYSVALDVSSYGSLDYTFHEAACPLDFEFKIGRTTVRKDLGEVVGNRSVIGRVSFREESVWLPGEVRVFSPNGNVTVGTQQAGRVINFSPGYRPESGLAYGIAAAQPGSTQFSVAREAVVSAKFVGNNAGIEGLGFYYTVKNGTGRDAATTNTQCLIDEDDVARNFGNGVQLIATDSSSLSSLNRVPKPIVSVITGLRYARDTNPNRDNILTNGIHNMNPTVGFIIASSAESVGRFEF